MSKSDLSYQISHTITVKLKEVVREHDNLYFIFEYMEQNLYQWIKSRDRYIPEQDIRRVTYQGKNSEKK